MRSPDFFRSGGVLVFGRGFFRVKNAGADGKIVYTNEKTIYSIQG